MRAAERDLVAQAERAYQVTVAAWQPTRPAATAKASRAGARTGVFAPALDRLYVAARAAPGSRDAAILVFRPTL